MYRIAPRSARTVAWLALPLAGCVSAVLAGQEPAKAPQSPAATAAAPSFEHSLQPLLNKSCLPCHNAKLKTADVDFSRFKTAESVAADPDLWEKAVEKLRTGAMPPKGIPRPPQAEIETVAKWIEGEIARKEASAKPDPGRVTARRLNRVEYNNTVHDLLAVDFRPADDFPQDDSGYGFDNIGDVLSLSPVLMERYLNAAEKVVQYAMNGPEKMKPTLIRHQPPKREFQLFFEPKFEYDLSGFSMTNALHVMHRFPVAGDYTFRVALEGRRPNGSEPVAIAFWIDGKKAQEFSIDAPSDGFGIDLFGSQSEFKLHVPSGEHWLSASVMRIYEGLPPSWHGPNPSKRPEPPPPDITKFMRKLKDPTPEQLEAERKKAADRMAKAKIAANRVYIHYVEVAGPYTQDAVKPVESRARIFTCGHTEGQAHTASCPRTIVSNFARRAFRRPVGDADVQPYLALYKQARQAGSNFDEAIGVALQGVLVAPDFLFRIERTEAARAPFRNASLSPDGGKAPASMASIVPIDQFSLASRLSYFLWSTMPDEELMRCAERGTLRNPATLKAQVQRMLKDPRSHALAENFAGQWLELRRLESVVPDREKFPDFDNYLRMSMRQETEMFFDDMVHQDRSVLELIDGKSTFVNQKLAEFYGIPGVTGTDFRRVSLEGTKRSGILTQASVLTVSSYATRTSPVLRGKWVLENLLNAPPPPPPPNVPKLDEEASGTTASIREQMEAHRANPMCASCHSKMDPLGFALENFNAIGAWREKDGKFPIDASGKLPDGRGFNGAAGLETLFRQQPDAFVECVTDKLLTYALGRGLERYDRRTVKEISKRVAGDDYRFSSLVLEIVNSLPFQMRRGEGAKS